MNEKIVLFAAIDTEFTKEGPVSLQIAIYHNYSLLEKTIIFNSELVNSELEEKIEKIFFQEGFEPVFGLFSDYNSNLHNFCSYTIGKYFPYDTFADRKFLVNVLFFYSPKDIEYSFGFNQIKEFLKKKQPAKKKPYIVQDRAIRGSFKLESDFYPTEIQYRLRDLKGYTNSSLQNLASSLSITMSSKNDLDEYKTCMDIALKEKTEVFIRYAMGDTLVLFKIFSKNSQNILIALLK